MVIQKLEQQCCQYVRGIVLVPVRSCVLKANRWRFLALKAAMSILFSSLCVFYNINLLSFLCNVSYVRCSVMNK